MGYVRPERAKRPANRPKWPLQSLRRPVWAIRFFEIHDPGAFDEHFFNGLLGGAFQWNRKTGKAWRIQQCDLALASLAVSELIQLTRSENNT
ncbi:hypothetical protein [Xenophilus sp. Marseille-Q4582]|uniref:hypothetical protein n=1 Tax=Xenophilus sp. Marseille-Q4582 TaxID=2866600 RepID=UPI001CE41C2A|nr:hypothetical protein [Xenophilus sp. Marseille-Q4582]